jgi:hypothetical protein
VARYSKSLNDPKNHTTLTKHHPRSDALHKIAARELIILSEAAQTPQNQTARRERIADPEELVDRETSST